MTADLIIPARPARKPRRPRQSPALPGVRAPSRERAPEVLPPPVLDALETDAEWLAFCDDRADDAVEHQDADPDAEWSDLPEWMHHAVDCDGKRIAQGRGEIIGTTVNGGVLWKPWPAGRA